MNHNFILTHTHSYKIKTKPARETTNYMVGMLGAALTWNRISLACRQETTLITHILHFTRTADGIREKKKKENKIKSNIILNRLCDNVNENPIARLGTFARKPTRAIWTLFGHLVKSRTIGLYKFYSINCFPERSTRFVPS